MPVSVTMKEMEKSFNLKLLATKLWKTKGVDEIRHEYDKRTNLMFKKETPGSLIGSQTDLESTSLKSTISYKHLKFSKKNEQLIPASVPILEKIKTNKLERLTWDKLYFQRLLVDEELRMEYIRKDKFNENILRNKPVLRLLMESMINNTLNKSNKLRKVIEKEIRFLDEREEIDRQFNFLQNFKSLNLGDIYDKNLQKAVKIKEYNDIVTEKLKYLWTIYDRGLYEKVNHNTKELINGFEKLKNTNSNTDRNAKLIKLKILADLNYLRGLSLMYLQKYDIAMTCFQNDQKIGQLSEFAVCNARAKDNIGRIHALKGNYKEALYIWFHRLKEVKNVNEKPWLCFVIAQCFALKKEYMKAVEMSKKCIRIARKVKSICWEFNGNILLANFAAVLGTSFDKNIQENTSLSLSAINGAYYCATMMANIYIIKNFLKVIVYIYNSFKDIDLAILEHEWSTNLLHRAEKESKNCELLNQNTSPEINDMIYNDDDNDNNNNNNNNNNNRLLMPQENRKQNKVSNITNEVFKEMSSVKLSNIVVDVYLTDIYDLSPSKDESKTQLLETNPFPISIVEVEYDEDDTSSEWDFESGNEEVK